jgi:TorA maturation chaperone TorD
MPASPELFRALGALCEPPESAHGPIAAALGLPPPADAASYTDMFVFQLMPYAAPYLSPDGMLGGETGDRVAGFWRALRLIPPAEPDHLAALLGLYATLAEREDAPEARPGLPGAWREARRALLWEHLLTWVPTYTAAMATLPSGFHAAWARLAHQALLKEAQGLPPPPATPMHLRGVPEMPDPGSGGFERALLTPVRSGLLLTRADLVNAAAANGLGARPGSRAFTLRALIDQDRAATFGWLAQRARWWAEWHRNAVPALGGIAQYWLGRAQASLRVLEQQPQHA